MSALELTDAQHVVLNSKDKYIDVLGELKAFFNGPAAVSALIQWSGIEYEDGVVVFRTTYLHSQWSRRRAGAWSRANRRWW